MRRACIAAAGLLLAACGNQVILDSNEAGNSNAAKTLGPQTVLQPGFWRIQTQIQFAGVGESIETSQGSLTVTGATAGEGLPRHTTCLYPADAARPLRTFGLPVSTGKGAKCSSDQVRIAGGKISGTMSCGADSLSVDGRYSSSAFEVITTGKVTGTASSGEDLSLTLPMTTKTRGQRIGDCPASKAAPSSSSSSSPPPPPPPPTG